MSQAIKSEGISKRYRLGGLRPGRLLYEEIGRFLTGRRRVDVNRSRGWIWALRDVSFEVEIGEVVGVVGRNGAGKSTLLRVLSRITEPTRGAAEVRGRLASLLEVGTGFHPELTGRENVFLNGAILGLTRREIAERFDEIVAFAEIERFLDTPVKHYSSGMYMRLAFAVAAHLEPDVLVVDEVLAVGDAAFQRKCLGRMESIAESGRTVLFVSHNLGAVRSLCSSLLLLEEGQVAFRGPVEEGLGRYERNLSSGAGEFDSRDFEGPLRGELTFLRLEVRQGGRPAGSIDPSVPVELVVEGEAHRAFANMDIAVALFRDGARLFTCHDGPPGAELPEGRFRSTIAIPAHVLRPGSYAVGVGARRSERGEWLWAQQATRIEVSIGLLESLDPRDVGAMTVRYDGRREPVGEP